MVRPFPPLITITAWALVCFAWTVGACGDDGAGTPAAAVDSTVGDTTADIGTKADTAPDAGGDAGSDAASDVTADAGADVGSIQTTSCPEHVVTPLTAGTALLYTCVSTGEVHDVQEIRRLPKDATEPETLVHVALPDQLGRSLAVSGEQVYYDTLRIEGSDVTARTLWRVAAAGGDPAVALELAPDDFATPDSTAFASNTRLVRMLPQPGGDRIALLLVGSTDNVGVGFLRIYEGGAQVFATDVIVSAFAWSPDGDRVAWVTGGALTLAAPDGSAGVTVDSSVLKTGIPPALLGPTSVAYAQSKHAVWAYTEAAGKEEVASFPDSNIEWLLRAGPTSVVVLAGTLRLVDVDTGVVTDLGEVGGFGLYHPSAAAPDASAIVVGRSLDNPFKSFDHRLQPVAGGPQDTLVTTEPGAGVVSTAVAWY